MTIILKLIRFDFGFGLDLIIQSITNRILYESNFCKRVYQNLCSEWVRK